MQRVRKQIEVPEMEINTNSVTVAVLDTGIGKHPDVTEKLILFKDFVGKQRKAYDDNGHGTHVCGIICGNGSVSGGKYKGIAPASRLIVGKVLDSNGEGNADAMLKALEWIMEIHESYKIRLVNISVGIGSLSSVEKEKELQRRLEELWDAGMVVVCAAGNKGPGNGSISAVGGNSRILTVGCHDGDYCKNHPRPCEQYSGRGDNLAGLRKPDLVAPGTDIISCNGAYRWRYGKAQKAYVAKSGTSMATPIVTGAIALLLQKCPGLTNEEIRQKITLTATDLREPWNKQGWGMVNVKRLLE